ncbi:rhomboid family intramembrane serine protease [Tuwongella immobilis]|uniref:Peptidase S54 rhomboid domain-containing protein n=1 Tax=Tuwongella immobilis TaxID=692036 RepID=A0A6C2YTU9_9BACT|nr:rhomboid family intramembrane serine protease [Tuwongella immobilis]VIP04312.1 rhomboid family protein : Peptidase S54, rhomboid domain OS=Sphingobacterium sp. (strain 21) GN=Sph21_3230 PE=4 SV=1: Rhomboid [Tuwongella immobilis]VTS05986.1 rhomboid family protein : Peptidase S54, rhomboid domain OS=Sphingobacterium sp. (strain 21) GN=Sph21_3230 PE=4 SV=1: Rhomboid [Tuwongella immobilis]
MMPLYDDNSDRQRTPYVTWTLIAINLFVFFVLQKSGENDAFTNAWSTVPKEILTGQDLATTVNLGTNQLTGEKLQFSLEPTPGSVYLTLLTSMFMHGSLMHLLGNMLFLYIFGDNVEDKLGHVKYIVFYLLTGIIASLCHVFLAGIRQTDLLIPCLGASGAISAVMAGYVITDPNRRVVVLVLRFLTEVPAWVMIGVWFLFQLINGIGLFGNDTESGGVAYAAHIGGFLAGAVLVYVMMPVIERR